MPSKSYREINTQLSNIDNQISKMETSLSTLSDQLTPLKDLIYCRWILSGVAALLEPLPQQIKEVKIANSKLKLLPIIQHSQALQNALLTLEDKKEQLTHEQEKYQWQIRCVTEQAVKQSERELRLRNSFVQDPGSSGENVQLYSLHCVLSDTETQLIKNSRQVEALCKKLDVISDDSEVDQKIQSVLTQINGIKCIVDRLLSVINQATTLHTLAKQNNIFSATVRGDIDALAKKLSNEKAGNPNQLYEGKKAIEYAAICGNLVVFSHLFECTTLSGMDIERLSATIEKLQQIESTQLSDSTDSIFTQMQSKINLRQHAKKFDHLWKKNPREIDAMQSVFKDYYSPLLFKKFSLFPENLAILNRILTGAWHRTSWTIKLARQMCNALDAKKSYDSALMREIIHSELTLTAKSFKLHLEKGEVNPHGTFASRIYYCAYRAGLDQIHRLIEPSRLNLDSKKAGVPLQKISSKSKTEAAHTTLVNVPRVK